MKHIRLQAEDVPPAPFLMDRRVSRERRMFWRGGRRDSDWTSRPLGAWDRLTDTPPGWKRVLASRHLW